MFAKQSFSKSVKEELCLNTYDSVERLKALLSSYIKINGHALFKNRQTQLILKTENAKIAKFIYKSITDLYHPEIHLTSLEKNNRSKKNIYTINITDKDDKILQDLHIDFLEGKLPKEIVYNDDTISGYLAGAFLASGSINSPETSNYHLEISLVNENYAKWLSRLFNKHTNSNLEPKITVRRDKYIIYFKKSDQIAVFLVMIGAVNSCMDFETYRTTRDFTNSNNRTMNLDTANMMKTVETGKRQVEEIKKIDERLGIKNIKSIKMKEVALLRLEHESASLQEIADLLSEKLEIKISKSNINHLFRNLHELYLKVGKK